MLVGVPSLSLATLDAVGRMKLSDPDVFRGGAGELATVTEQINGNVILRSQSQQELTRMAKACTPL